MDITAFIRELLFGHDCVIVPGFGGFIGNHTPARIDKNTGTFYPPVKQISFNRNLNHNDGLLIGKISGSAKISYGDARNLVEEYVVELRKKLYKGDKIVFDHIGSFVNNQEGNIQFEPDRNANYHLGSYGLESFQWLPLEGYDVRKRILRHVDKDPVRPVSWRKILWRAAIIIPLLSVVVAVSLKTDFFRAKVETTTMNPLVTAEFEQNKKAVDQVVKNDTAIISGDEPAVKEVPLTDITAVPVTPVEKNYVVITGSFKSEDNALVQVNLLKEAGFSPEIETASNGFYRVCAIACSDFDTAKSKKDSIAKQFPGTWISKRR